MAIRLLIVDDAAFMRLSIRNMVTKYGVEVVGEASNGIEAIKLYKSETPDIVTMDITMPEMNGIEAISEIKKIDKNAKIIVISAMGNEMNVKDAIIAGAVGFLVKPFKESDVMKNIERFASAKV